MKYRIKRRWWPTVFALFVILVVGIFSAMHGQPNNADEVAWCSRNNVAVTLTADKQRVDFVTACHYLYNYTN